MTDSIKQLALDIAQVVLERKGLDPVIIDMGSLVDYAGYLVICSGRSGRQVGALADAIEGSLRPRGYRTRHIEGKQNRVWVLMDYGDIVVHIFHEESREQYGLERLWFDAPRVPVPELPPAVAGGLSPSAPR